MADCISKFSVAYLGHNLKYNKLWAAIHPELNADEPVARKNKDIPIIIIHQFFIAILCI